MLVGNTKKYFVNSKRDREVQMKEDLGRIRKFLPRLKRLFITVLFYESFCSF